jgi:hypothetical protein
MRISVMALPLLLAVPVLCSPIAQEPPLEAEELALRQDNSWTQIEIVLRNGQRATFKRSDIKQINYLKPVAAKGITVVHITEAPGEARNCTGTWTQQGTSKQYAAAWHCSWGVSASDTMTLESSANGQIVFFRQGMKWRYVGTLSADGKTIVSGAIEGIAGSHWIGTIE